MSDCDLLIRGGRVVLPSGMVAADVAIAQGAIVAVGPDLEVRAAEVVDATGLHVCPGGIDSHVHFNEPGRTDWETIAEGSEALAAGGYTSFVDMPLNSRPVTIDSEAFDMKLEAATASSLVDFGLWGGLVPGNLDRLEELHERGVLGFKAFMCPSGIDDFPAADDHTLFEGMRRIARLGSILLLHAENAGLVEALAREATAQGRTGPRDFVRSRPAVAELEAISRAIFFAGETGCRIHVVHVSTARGVETIHRARLNGVDASCETCPHYLLYTEEDVDRFGGLGKCAPPLRSTEDRDGLWAQIMDGSLPMVVSDHSPSTVELKRGADFFELWGGISGCQLTRQLLLAGLHGQSLDIGTVVALTAANVARRFGLSHKGEIKVGHDADLWLVDLSHEDVVRAEDLRYHNSFSVHEGHAIRGHTARTLVRGQTIFMDGQVVSRPIGRLMRTGRTP